MVCTSNKQTETVVSDDVSANHRHSNREVGGAKALHLFRKGAKSLTFVIIIKVITYNNLHVLSFNCMRGVALCLYHTAIREQMRINYNCYRL